MDFQHPIPKPWAEFTLEPKIQGMPAIGIFQLVNAEPNLGKRHGKYV